MVVGWRPGAAAWARMFSALLEARGVERRDGPKGKDNNSVTVTEIATEAGCNARPDRLHAAKRGGFLDPLGLLQQ